MMDPKTNLASYHATLDNRELALAVFIVVTVAIPLGLLLGQWLANR